MERHISEGKTLEPPTQQALNIDPQPCGGCETEDSTHYCTHCTIGLCTKCERIHRKGKLYQDHQIVPINDTTDQVTLVRDHKIPRPKGASYLISECKHTGGDTVVLYSRADDKEVITFDVKTQSMNTFTCDRNIFYMTSLSTNRHVIIDFAERRVHLLNKNFKVITTLRGSAHDSTYRPGGVCSESVTSFILQEKLSGKVRFSRVYTNGDALVRFVLGEVDLDTNYISMSFHKDYNAVLLPRSKSLIYMLNLQTMKPVTYDYSAYNPKDRRYAMDRTCNRILVVDANRQILLFDVNGAYKGVFDTDGAVMTDAALRGTRLVLSVDKGEDKHIIVYNIDMK